MAEPFPLAKQLAALAKCYDFKRTTEAVFRVSDPSGSFSRYPAHNNTILFYWWSLCMTAQIMKSIKDAVCLLQRDGSSHCLAGKEINDSSASTLLATVWSYQFSSQLESSCFSHSTFFFFFLRTKKKAEHQKTKHQKPRLTHTKKKKQPKKKKTNQIKPILWPAVGHGIINQLGNIYRKESCIHVKLKVRVLPVRFWFLPNRICKPSALYTGACAQCHTQT